MLTHSKVQEVTALLGQGLSKSKAAKIAGISRQSLYNIEHGIHRPRRRLPVRCPICGSVTTLSPCPICAGRQARRSASLLSPGEADSSPSGEETADSRPQTAAEDIFDLDLHGDELARYQEMRRKVEYEISIGIRNANGYINR